MTEIPSEAQVLEWMTSLSNWGRWGEDDQKGCLKTLCSVTLHSATLHSAALSSVHVYARVHTSIYIYIYYVCMYIDK